MKVKELMSRLNKLPPECADMEIKPFKLNTMNDSSNTVTSINDVTVGVWNDLSGHFYELDKKPYNVVGLQLI